MNYLRSHDEFQSLCGSIRSRQIRISKRVHHLRMVEARHQEHAAAFVLHHHESSIGNTQLGLVIAINILLSAGRHVLQAQVC